ncbi:MAG: tetratricopeptide repeat protein [Pirellulales bacterium]|nr:tetratricopeptide repeat protein [Pirellulales bacterium]
MSTADELYNAADELKEAGQIDAAINKLHEALGVDPNHALTHTALSVLYTRQGKHAEAVQHGLRVCELEPNDPFSFTSMSVTFMRAGKIPEAEEAMARSRMLQQTR